MGFRAGKDLRQLLVKVVLLVLNGGHMLCSLA
jgi:hypothetical protein